MWRRLEALEKLEGKPHRKILPAMLAQPACHYCQVGRQAGVELIF